MLKFFAAGIFYGMATLEGPRLLGEERSGLAHYTDWIAVTCTVGAGWTASCRRDVLLDRAAPHTAPSSGRASWPTSTSGSARSASFLYVIAMWVAGIEQGLMWRALDPDGALSYASFLQTVVRIRPMYWLRLLGGVLYLGGMLIMAFNLWKTFRQGKAVDGETTAPPLGRAPELPWRRVLFGAPLLLSAAVIGLVIASGALDQIGATGAVLIAAFLAVFVGIGLKLTAREGEPRWHRVLEGPGLFTSSR